MMQHNMTARAAGIFVCCSSLDLQTVCHHIQLHYHLPAFRFGEHNSWEYARSIGPQIGFNLTKTERLDTIAQWVAGVPENVNYQILLFLDQRDTTARDTAQRARVTAEEVSLFLRDVFATDIVWVGPQQGAA